jgi:hypothetical protein
VERVLALDSAPTIAYPGLDAYDERGVLKPEMRSVPANGR